MEILTTDQSMIGYPNYKLYFTVWALGRYQNVYLPMLKELEIPK